MSGARAMPARVPANSRRLNWLSRVTSASDTISANALGARASLSPDRSPAGVARRRDSDPREAAPAPPRFHVAGKIGRRLWAEFIRSHSMLTMSAVPLSTRPSVRCLQYLWNNAPSRFVEEGSRSNPGDFRWPTPNPLAREIGARRGVNSIRPLRPLNRAPQPITACRSATTRSH